MSRHHTDAPGVEPSAADWLEDRQRSNVVVSWSGSLHIIAPIIWRPFRVVDEPRYDLAVGVEHLGPRSLRQLLDAVLAIGSELDLDRALTHIVETAVSLVDARYGALGVLDEARSGLSSFITVGIDERTHGAIGQLPKGLGLLGSLITDARPLRVPVIAEHPERSGFPPSHPPMTSFLGVPVVSRGAVFGNLYLTDKTSAEAFTDLDEQLVSGLAAAAGIVIDNARLYGAVRRRDAALTAIHATVSAIAARGEGNAALQLVSDRACELAGADAATIALPGADGESLIMEIVSGQAASGLRGPRLPDGVERLG